jgi:hypothetical protein
MTLGTLKKAINKFPPDMNDMEMAIRIVRNGKVQCELLCFIGYVEKIPAFMLGGETAIRKMIADGDIKSTEYIPTSELGYIELED